MQISLRILVPAYNEAGRISTTLESYVSFFRSKLPNQFQCLVILNGCKDNTREIVETIQKKYSEIQLIEFLNPIGKGGAIIEGLKESNNVEFIGYADADGATSPEALWGLFLACQTFDAVVGSRWLKDSKVLRLQSIKRRIASRGFHWLVRLILGLNIKDTQCGAKIFRSEAIKTVYDQLFISDMAFDVNLLYVLKRAGFQIKELPTTWKDQSGSKVKLRKTAASMFLSLIRLRLIYSPLRGLLKYTQPIENWIYSKLR